MEPYYEDTDSGITIYHGDCREVAECVAADVLVTDPPYGVGLTAKATKDGSYHQVTTLYSDTPEEVRALVREAVPGLLSRCERAVIFPGAAMTFAYPEPSGLGCVFTPSGAGSGPWGFQCCHPVLFYGPDPFLADGRGRRPNSFWTTAPVEDRIDHPCPKPLRWMTWAVERASRPGEMVLDPFMGSGTTLVAAKQLGRKAIGIEIEERYCEIAAKRLAQGVLPLFEPGVVSTYYLPYQSEDGPIEGTAVIVPVSCPKCGSGFHVINTSRTTTGTQATAVLRCPSCGNHGTEYTVQVFLRALRQPGDPRERPACGTATGYRYHQRHREAPCEACLEAYGRWMNPDNAPIGGGVGGQRKREMMAVET